MKACIYIGTSLDGYIAREDGSFDWLSRFADQEAVDAYTEFIGEIDAIVIGRGTFETVLTFPDWPYDKPVFVLSNSLSGLPTECKGPATLLSMPPRELLEHLSAIGINSAYIDGGKVIQAFLAEDLIDELTIAQVPVVLGSGIPLFGSQPNLLEFTHLRTTTASNGLIRSYYCRTRN
jgi:dihydrofolate reductase